MAADRRRPSLLVARSASPPPRRAPIFAYTLAGTDMQGFTFAAACALLSFVLYFKHWQNIRRLWNGTEPKIGSEKPKA